MKDDNIATSIENGLKDNSIILKKCSAEYLLFSIKKHLYIWYSRWKGVPERKYLVTYEDRRNIYGISGFIFGIIFFCLKARKYSNGT